MNPGSLSVNYVVVDMYPVPSLLIKTPPLKLAWTLAFVKSIGYPVFVV